MIIPMLISWVLGENDFNGFLYSFLVCITIGSPLWYLTRYNRSLTNRDGFAIVTFSWITTAVIGSLPFIFLVQFQISQMHFLNLCQVLRQRVQVF